MSETDIHGRCHDCNRDDARLDLALRAATERIERLEKALKPFADALRAGDQERRDEEGFVLRYTQGDWHDFTVGDLRRAAAALSPQEPA